MQNNSRLIQAMMLGMLVFLGNTAHLQAQEKSETTSVNERWYIMLVENKPAGWLRESTETDGDKIISTTHTQLSLRRDNATIIIETESHFTETR